MAAFNLMSPNRVLDNIKRMELQEAELPSLPSIQPNLDYDSAAETTNSSFDADELRRFGGDDSLQDSAIPHVSKRPFASTSTSTAVPHHAATPGNISSSTSSSPFPPIRPASASSSDTTPYIPSRALTSTPHSLHSRSHRFVSDNNDTRSTTRNTARHSRNRSDTDEFVTGNSTGRERWHTPGEMSRSFEGEDILPNDDDELPSLPPMGELGSERSIPLQDASESFVSAPTDSPITKRLSHSHVQLSRPGRRSHLSQTHIADSSAGSVNDNMPSPILEESSMVHERLLVPVQDRVPSLSRSEISATDTSGAASTPEAPARQSVPPSSARRAGRASSGAEVHTSAVSDGAEAPTYDYAAEVSAATSVVSFDATPAPVRRRASPVKRDTPLRVPADTPASQVMSTPGLAREPPPHHEDFDSRVIHAQTPHLALRDITESHQASLSPFTPSPAGMISKTGDFSTPRAVLNDAERRKSHVLAVLSSTGIPNRLGRTRGTPHPLRRMSTSPLADTPVSAREPSRASRADLSMDRSASAPPNESFVSVASSADLTTDRRATTHPRLSRANASFPTILLPGNQTGTSAGGSLRGLGAGVGDGRADGVKIHKHLNAMNRQLLESNADLAREAEAWRDEVGRLRGLLEEAGVEVEDVDTFAGIDKEREGRSVEASAVNLSDLTRESIRPGTGGGGGEAGLTAEEMQELADKLEGLEELLNEKHALIADLHDEISALRSTSSAAVEMEEVADLRLQLEEAEEARHALQADFAAKTEQHAKRFGEICAGFEEQVGNLESELAGAKRECERVKEDRARLERLSQSNGAGEREVELRKQVQAAGVEMEGVRAELARREMEVARVIEERKEVEDRATRVETQVEELQVALHAAQRDLEVAVEQMEEMAREVDENKALMKDMEEQMAAVAEQVEALEHARNGGSEGMAEKVEQLVGKIAELEEELDNRDRSATAGMSPDDLDALRTEIEDLHAIVEEKDAALAVLQGKVDTAQSASDALRHSISQVGQGQDASDQVGDQTNSFVAVLEERLDAAYREIGRLKHELASSPRRKDVMEVKDARIVALEREKAVLKERLAAVRSSSMTPAPVSVGGMSKVLAAGSPFGKPTLVHRAIAGLRTPLTPGPMKEFRAAQSELMNKLSWLQSTLSDANEPLLRAQVEYLQTELAHVNGQLDANFSRLEEAGLGGIELAEKLVAARKRIAELEDEIRALVQRNKAGSVLVHEQMKERSSETQQQWEDNLREVRTQLESVKNNAAREHARLQADLTRLRSVKIDSERQAEEEVNALREEVARAVESATAEVEDAKKEAVAASREALSLRKQVQVAESARRKVEAELKEMERQADEMRRTHKQQTQHMTDTASSAQSALLAQQTAELASLRSQLEDARHKFAALSAQLVTADSARGHAETRVADLLAERATIGQDLEELERDFNLQRGEARLLGEQLELLHNQQASVPDQREEVERLERNVRELEGRMRRAEQEMVQARDDAQVARRWREDHNCSVAAQSALDEQRSRFKAQSRELATQIRYLKAKFTREATFRNGLAVQKRYLLLMVGGMSLNEQATLKLLANMGYPAPDLPRKRVSLKSVGLAVLGLIRARNSAARWKAEKDLKAGAVASFEERRRVSGRS